MKLICDWNLPCETDPLLPLTPLLSPNFLREYCHVIPRGLRKKLGERGQHHAGELVIFRQHSETRFMIEPKIKIERNLYATLKQAAEVAGYSSVDEFITHILEKTAAEVQQAQSEEEVRKRLQGLGYIE